MNMNDERLMCSFCFEALAKKNPDLARLYDNLCSAQKHPSIPFLKVEQDFPNLRNLELMGMIVTTDAFHYILARVKEKKMSKEDSFFCGGLCGR